MSEFLRATARAIFAEALAAVDIRAAIHRELALDLNGIDRILIIAIGKAAVPMHAAAVTQLCEHATQGIVVAPLETIPAAPAANTIYLRGDHPTPTANSLKAAQAILKLLATANDRTAVLFLISGGASAMVEQPLDPAIALEDIAALNRALVGSGLPIAQMNTLRKHLSAVKGGRLALAASRAALQHTLLISDVPVALPDAIASGPSLPDTSTLAQTRTLFQHLDQATTLPQTIRTFFLDPNLPETPKADNPAFARATWKVILSSDHLAAAARTAAESRGFHTTIDNSCDDQDYREAANYLLTASAALAQTHKKTCLISVGEVTITLPPNAGQGGRNSQFALHCATQLALDNNSHTAVLSAGTDGIDGHSLAAGAVCDATTLTRAAALGLNTTQALQTCNTAPLLSAVNDSITIGPTGNNLRDLRLILTDRP